MSPTRFRCANSLNGAPRMATCRDERKDAPQHRPATIPSGSCSVTVITGDSESLNPGSIPGRTLRAGASLVFLFLDLPGLRKIFIRFFAPTPSPRGQNRFHRRGAGGPKNQKHSTRSTGFEPATPRFEV